MTPPRPVDLEAAFGTFDERWNPRIVAALNGQEVKIAKVEGAFDRHAHDDEDELFLVVRGRLRIEFDDGDATLEEGQILVVPRGVPHRPVADEEAWILLFEPAGTLNTGNVRTARTVESPRRLDPAG